MRSPSTKNNEPQLEFSLDNSVVYTGHECSFVGTAGIRLYFPNAQCKTPIKVSVNIATDDYILPLGYEDMIQVSEMYEVTSSDTLPIPVTIQIEHCALVDNQSYIVYMVAHGTPPYHLKPIYDGKFPFGESYGELKTKQFSIFTILAKKLGLRMSLSVHIFYRSEVTVNYVVTKNLQQHIQAIEEEYADAIRTVHQQMFCDYATEAISLVVPEPTPDGWCVEPEIRPAVIESEMIRQYIRGKAPPNVQLSIMWMGRSGDEQVGTVEIKVEGGSVTSFTLICTPPSMVAVPSTTSDVTQQTLSMYSYCTVKL